MFEHASNQTGLIRSESPLTPAYTPPRPINRTHELERIANAVRPLVRRNQPANLLVFGPTGVGKTLLVTHVLENLSEETRVTTAFINCWQYNTRSSLITELLIQLGYPAPRKGKPVDELLVKLREWLDKHHGAIVLLDEFDQLTDQTRVAYDLQEASYAAENGLGLILVSNQPPEHLELEPRSQSRISYQRLEIQPYTEEGLATILHERVDQAFHRDTVDDGVLELIAATVAAANGDCREALTLLLRAARLAEHQNKETVTVTHVEQLTAHGHGTDPRIRHD